MVRRLSPRQSRRRNHTHTVSRYISLSHTQKHTHTWPSSSTTVILRLAPSRCSERVTAPSPGPSSTSRSLPTHPVCQSRVCHSHACVLPSVQIQWATVFFGVVLFRTRNRPTILHKITRVMIRVKDRAETPLPGLAVARSKMCQAGNCRGGRDPGETVIIFFRKFEIGPMERRPRELRIA